MHLPGDARYIISCLVIMMSNHLFRLARKSVQMFFIRDTFLKFYNELFRFILFQVVQIISASLLIIMSSPGQKQGSCGHVMAIFDNHKKWAHCCGKGVGDDPCVKKLDCQICKAFMPSQIIQLATPTYVESRRNLKLAVTRPPLLWTHQRSLFWDRLLLTSRLQLNLPPTRRRSVLMALQGPANVNTAVNLLQMISSPLMTSGVRGYPA